MVLLLRSCLFTGLLALSSSFFNSEDMTDDITPPPTRSGLPRRAFQLWFVLLIILFYYPYTNYHPPSLLQGGWREAGECLCYYGLTPLQTPPATQFAFRSQPFWLRCDVSIQSLPLRIIPKKSQPSNLVLVCFIDCPVLLFNYPLTNYGFALQHWIWKCAWPTIKFQAFYIAILSLYQLHFL